MSNPPFHTFKGLERELQSFLAAYGPDRHMVVPEEAIRKFIPKNQRVCRFCGKRMPETSFKKEAHVIPQLLGNKYLVSSFECDQCNSLFSKYETDLANWLGIMRTVVKPAGKTKAPTFKSADKKLTARQVRMAGNEATKISTPLPDKSVIDVNTETGRTVTRYTKTPYTPVNVYRALLKVALCMLHEDETSNYRRQFEFLRSENIAPAQADFVKVICHALPNNYRYPHPVALLMHRKDPDARLPRYTFVLYWENLIFSFPLFLDQRDIDAGHYRNYDMTALFPPPMVLERPGEDQYCVTTFPEFHRTGLVTCEEGEMVLEATPEVMSNLDCFDPETGQWVKADLDTSEIVGIYMAPEGTTIDISQLIDGKLDDDKNGPQTEKK